LSERLKYVEIVPRTRAELEQRFERSDPNVVCDALYTVAQHDSDWCWSQDQCLKMLQHELICAFVSLVPIQNGGLLSRTITGAHVA
jgi:hypothetical protein